MSGAGNRSVFDRPLRADLAAFFAVRCCPASRCAQAPERPLVGVLAELARHGFTR